MRSGTKGHCLMKIPWDEAERVVNIERRKMKWQ